MMYWTWVYRTAVERKHMTEISELHLEFHPVIAKRWQDLEALFGERGACGGCWCMWWRIPRSQFEQQKGQTNKEALRTIVLSGGVPGLLAYVDGRPIAWCAIAPRESYSALARSRILKRVDDQSVWSVTCLFVAKPFRRKGVTPKLLRAAVEYAQEQGAEIVEGYPVEPKHASMPDTFAWTGLVSAFRKAGFVEVLRRSETRPIMRYSMQTRVSGKEKSSP
jgi:GNAT superfamily N-acetyltransferase